MKLIDKSAVMAEIEKIIADETESIKTFEHSKNVSERQRSNARIEMLMYIRSLLDTLEVKEVKLPSPRFPHLNNIVDKVFGTGNLESLEYEEAEQLVLLAKEELLKDLEVKEVDLKNELKEDWLFADKTEVDCLECMCLTEDMFVSIAKKYFQLGLKARKGK